MKRIFLLIIGTLVLLPTLPQAMADTSLITPAFGNMKGTFINDLTTPRIVMFPTTTNKVGRVVYTATYDSGIMGNHLISGLYPGVVYFIYKDGVQLTTIRSSDQGTVSFSATGGTKWEVSRYMIDDLTFYPTPSTSRPPKYAASNDLYIDPVFKSSIRRITNSPTDVPGTSFNYAQPGYPKHNIENADGTRLIIQSFRQPLWHIWNADPPYKKIRDFPTSPCNIGNATDPDARWDHTNPNIVYYTCGPKFYQWDITKASPTILYDATTAFPTAAVLTTKEEGDCSDDNRWWAWMVYNSSYTFLGFIVYDKQNNLVTASCTPSDVGKNCTAKDSLSMSPSGNYVYSAAGLFVWDRNLNYLGQLDTHTDSHNDFGIDSEGNEVIVDVQPYPDYLDSQPRYWRMINIATKEITWLAPSRGSDCSSSSCWACQHTSGNQSPIKPGWIVGSLECPYYPANPTHPASYESTSPPTLWAEHSVFMVELRKPIGSATPDNHSKIWRIAHTHSYPRKNYADSPYAKINRAGTKIWFGSGWGTTIREPPQQYDTYQIDLPPSWYEDLASTGAPSRTPPPIPSATDGEILVREEGSN